MTIMRMILLSIFLSGCNLYAGIGVRPVHYDNREINRMPNPIGYLEATQDLGKNFTVFFEHMSSIPEKKEDAGMNLLGIKYKLR